MSQSKKDRRKRDTGGSRFAALLRSRTSLGVSSAIGVAATMVIALTINVLASRHYKRWDWTAEGLFTLSPHTRQTLHDLHEPIEIYVLLSGADPLELTTRHVLEAYRAETRHLVVDFTDPDRNPAKFLAIQQRYKVVAGKTEDGRIVTDAALIVARGDQHHFVTSEDLVHVDPGEERSAQPRVEEALTGAIRKLRERKRPRICLSTGAGEASLEAPAPEGMHPFGDRFTKLNYEVVALPTLGELQGRDPIADCKLVVVAAPQRKMPDAQRRRIALFVEGGGNLLVAAGPVPDEQQEDYVDQGLGPLLALAGVERRRDFVFERDPNLRAPQGYGEMLLPLPAPHAITDGFLKQQSPIPIVMTVASSLAPREGPLAPTALLRTSEKAFGMRDFFKWAENPTTPEPRAEDSPGPVVLAYATERPKVDSSAPHGARVVVIGSGSVIVGANWHSPELRGAAMFVENAIAWLAAEPIVLDIPPRKSRRQRVSAGTLDRTTWRVVAIIPGATTLFGLLISFRRRRGERREDPRDLRSSPAKRRRREEEEDDDARDESEAAVPSEPPKQAKKARKKRSKKKRKKATEDDA